jgi:DNA helicase-2/ATP-dependent DNA helicase PcrA
MPRDRQTSEQAAAGAPAPDTEDILAGLNPRQIEAVTHGEGPLLIFAGAGSGKTTVLTRRVAYLISQGEHPGSVLAITFTNKAADELKTRIQALLGDRAKGVWAMTFHSACVRILRAELPHLGRSGKFSIADEQDQTKLMKQVLKELDLSEKQYPPGGILRAISAAKDNLIGPAEYASDALTFYETKVAQAYSAYQEKLREQDSLDFDDLIMETVLMFRQHPDVLGRCQAKFRNILVDEYQDTNHAQYELTRLLASLPPHNIAVVGDDDQSIYTFRGADIRNILEFERDYPACHVVKLEQNYRSSQVILDGAWHVVSNNAMRKDKRLWTSKEGGVPITIYAAQSGEDEARFVAGEIEQLMVQGVPASSIAILYRVNAQSRQFEDEFVTRRLPYSVLSGRRFYERKHVKDAVSYMRLLLNPRDAAALDRVMSEPPRGLGPSAFGKITAHARQTGASLVDALRGAVSVKGLNAGQKKSAADLGSLLTEVAAKVEAQPLHHTMNEILERSGYLRYLEAQDPNDAMGRQEDLDEFMISARVAHENGESLQDFLERCSLASEQDSYDEKKESCVMGTLHSAKGLEFEVVFLVGMEEGLLPHERSIRDERQVEEERRLMYVGMTRAKRLLYLTFSWSREMNVGLSRVRVSRFVSEIPRGLLEVKTWEG